MTFNTTLHERLLASGGKTCFLDVTRQRLLVLDAIRVGFLLFFIVCFRLCVVPLISLGLTGRKMRLDIFAIPVG